MAYSELIKSFQKIRDYMRQFYVYGFKSRTEYDKKSARSYDNERRRIESWMGPFMGFRQTPEGKNVFISVDSRSISANPLYKAFKAKSFTDGDVTFHFYVLDLLRDGKGYTAQEILDLFYDQYLYAMESDWEPDLSNIRKKLKEYESLGLLRSEKRGRELTFFRNDSSVALGQWADTLAFFSEAEPLGIVGSTLLDKLREVPGYFRFKHHYILHTLDSQILAQLLCAIGEHRSVTLTNASIHRDNSACHTVFPLKIYVSTQGGRQYLLCYNYRNRRMMFLRLDYIQSVIPGDPDPSFEEYEEGFRRLRPYLWGTSGGSSFRPAHLEMTVSFEPEETFIPQRLEREKRNGSVELLDERTARYSVDTCDPMEMIPWIRTFIGRIEKLECSDPRVEAKFRQDLAQTLSMYGGEA